MVIEIDLNGEANDLEVSLGYLCNHLERSNKAVNDSIEELLELSHGGLILGTSQQNQKRIENKCTICNELLKTQIQLISVIEPTLKTLNLRLKRCNSK